MTIYHMHHIVPRHAGGSDDPSNLVRLTVEEHAEAHRILYEKYGKEQDRIAWLGLSGMIDREEAIKRSIRVGQTNTANNYKFTSDDRRRGAKSTNDRHKDLPSKGGKALWNKPGMREYLSEKRREQHAKLGNPMKGRKQRRVCCIFCRKETAVNTLKSNHKKCG